MKNLHAVRFLNNPPSGRVFWDGPPGLGPPCAGANEDIRLAVVGFNGRGEGPYQGLDFMLDGVRLTALCDVDKKVLDAETARLASSGTTVEACQDIRKLLESKNVDAISIATPNHWHALASVWGMQAGKDVYVEKPVSHDVWEGEKMVEAARALQENRPGRHPIPLQPRPQRGGRMGAKGQFGKNPGGRARFATSRAPALAKRTARNRFLPRWITICGAGRHP